MRFLSALAALALVLCSIALAEEQSAAAPEGWDCLRFGMTLDEVIAALGPKAKMRRNPVGDDPFEKPFRFGSERQLVMAETVDLAEQLLKESKAPESRIPTGVSSAAQSLLKATKPRRWGTRRTQGTASLRILGPYNNVRLSAAKAEEKAISHDDLDEPSRNFVAQVIADAHTVSSFQRRRDLEAHDAGDLLKITDPKDLVISPVTMCGVDFSPEVTFEPRLKSITLHYGDNADIKLKDWIGLYEKLSKEIQSKYGPPASATIDETGRRRVWQFPKSEVTVVYRTNTHDTPQFYNGQTQLRSSTVKSVTLAFVSTEKPAPAPMADEQAPVPVRRRNMLGPKTRLKVGDSIVANLGRYRATLLPDGNFVVQREHDHATLWSTTTAGKGVVAVVMLEDGNAVLENAEGRAMWASGTAGRAGACLFVQDDGNLVIYDDSTATRPLWAANCTDR